MEVEEGVVRWCRRSAVGRGRAHRVRRRTTWFFAVVSEWAMDRWVSNDSEMMMERVVTFVEWRWLVRDNAGR